MEIVIGSQPPNELVVGIFFGLIIGIVFGIYFMRYRCNLHGLLNKDRTLKDLSEPKITRREI